MKKYMLTPLLALLLLFSTSALAQLGQFTQLDIGAGITVDLYGATLSVDRVNIQASGTLKTTNGAINVSRSWDNAGTFIAGSGTVNFQVLDQYATINGNNQFYDLYGTVSNTGNTIILQSGNTQTVSNSLTLMGSPTIAALQTFNPLLLRSSIAGQQANIDLLTGGIQNINMIDVQNNSATGQWLASGLPAQFNAIDSGNNHDGSFKQSVYK